MASKLGTFSPLWRTNDKINENYNNIEHRIGSISTRIFGYQEEHGQPLRIKHNSYDSSGINERHYFEREPICQRSITFGDQLPNDFVRNDANSWDGIFERLRAPNIGGIAGRHCR